MAAYRGTPDLPLETTIPTSDEPSTALGRGHEGEGFVLTGPATPVADLLRGLWRFRALLIVLAKKDFYVRYRRTALGVLWAIGLPLVQAAVLAVVFSRVVPAHTLVGDRVSYTVFLYAGLVPWTFVAAVLPGASTAIVDNLGMITKIYFPRLLTVLLVVLSGLVPLLTGEAILIALTATLGPGLGPELLWLVPGTALLLVLVAGFGAVLSALHVYSRDVRYVVQALMTVGLYVTPVLYPLGAAPDGLRIALAMVPSAGPVELFRAATVGPDEGWQLAVAASCVWAVAMVAWGLRLQSRRDRVFVDLL